MLNIGPEDIKQLIDDEKKMEKEREIARINEDIGKRLPPLENFEKERVNENKKRVINRSESTMRSKFGAKVADEDD